jgi:hypothetical protein
MASSKHKSHKQEMPKPPVSDIYDFSDEALSQLKTWIEQSGLKIPASQLVGSATVPNAGSVTTQNVVDALKALGILQQSP